MTLIADSIAACPEIQKAKASILKEMANHSKKLTAIAPPSAELKVSYEAVVAAMNSYRGQDLFFPLIGSGAGNGALVELADGSVKYDCIAGIGTHFGHSHPLLLEAGLDAALQNIPMQGNLMQNQDSVALSELILKTAGMDHCLLSTSGAMATENGLKLLFHNRYPAARILAFEGCFMGRTLALSSITDKPQYREGLPLQLHVDYIPFYDWKEPEKSTKRAVKTLKSFLSRYPGQYAAMCMELIQGENGFYPGSAEYFTALIELLKKAEVPLLVDEVQTFGRTTHPFAFQHFGLEKYVDVVCVGKISQVCATLYTKALRPRPGLLSQTFTSSTASIRCSLAIINSMLHEGFFGLNGRNMRIRKQFVDHLKEIEKKHGDLLSGPYGMGLMIGCTPYGGHREKVLALVRRLFDAGLITFFAGNNPTRLRFLFPAGSITDEDLEKIAAIFKECLIH